MTTNDDQAQITFEVSKCRTLRIDSTDLFDCLAEKQYLICGYALPFGNGHFCRHPQRTEFAKRLPGTKPVNPTQTEKAE